ncbi:hypothetical protein AVEN_122624-1 [Araneus ventricosus]|uniref:Uncharacterized protein n=1 Tax=Araneus ventricosus TaxID=182803 RepID=A0A4Y2FFQ4_ARAVE|nr:hypothetical protein AVEN_122624-1 [Araneus ventricosus]
MNGRITVNGASHDMRVFRMLSCYIMQEDHLLPYLTVREPIQLAARLKIPSCVSRQDMEKAKGGNDQRLASSYRPISLLPTIGKMLEKLMTLRLTYHLESTDIPNDREQGFRDDTPVDAAINELLIKIQIARRDGKHVLVHSNDIKGTFDNLQHRVKLF